MDGTFRKNPSRATVVEVGTGKRTDFSTYFVPPKRLNDSSVIMNSELDSIFREQAPLRQDSSLLYEQRLVVVDAVRE